MDLIVIRHGRAGTPAEFARNAGMSDDLRPLTIEGRRRMRRNAAGIKAIVGKLDAIATSPLVRAVETAHIVAKAFRDNVPTEKVEEVPDLAPTGKRERVLRWLAKHPATATVAIVGHEPSLSALVSWLIAGVADRSSVELKKGGACALRLEKPAAASVAGSAKLQWLMTPRQLRRQGHR
jgi:phosphohistidine phosphatase